MDNPVVLVTGASSGIGRSCAARLAAHGWTVVGASRRADPGEGWTSIAMDVDDDASVSTGVAQVVREHGGVDAVVPCAGWGLAGAVEQTPLDQVRAQLETNFFGVVKTVTAALPSLRERAGRIVVISSIGGVIGLPFQAYYSASKFALEGWAEALAWEMKPFGVAVSLVQPGNFRTGFTGARRTVEASGDDPYRTARDKAIGQMASDEQAGADPAAVAAAVERALLARRPRRRASVGPASERAGVVAKRLLPARVFEAASASSLGV